MGGDGRGKVYPQKGLKIKFRMLLRAIARLAVLDPMDSFFYAPATKPPIFGTPFFLTEKALFCIFSLPQNEFISFRRFLVLGIEIEDLSQRIRVYRGCFRPDQYNGLADLEAHAFFARSRRSSSVIEIGFGPGDEKS
jgi:hypothetical protein